jgi:hypothetical protein
MEPALSLPPHDQRPLVNLDVPRMLDATVVEQNDVAEHLSIAAIHQHAIASPAQNPAPSLSP